MVSTKFSYTWDDVKDHNVGDVFLLQGQRVKLIKKTNRAIAVEEYRWIDAVEDWVLDRLGKYLP